MFEGREEEGKSQMRRDGGNAKAKYGGTEEMQKPDVAGRNVSGNSGKWGKLVFFFVSYCHLKKCQYLCTK